MSLTSFDLILFHTVSAIFTDISSVCSYLFPSNSTAMLQNPSYVYDGRLSSTNLLLNGLLIASISFVVANTDSFIFFLSVFFTFVDVSTPVSSTFSNTFWSLLDIFFTSSNNKYFTSCLNKWCIIPGPVGL